MASTVTTTQSLPIAPQQLASVMPPYTGWKSKKLKKRKTDMVVTVLCVISQGLCTLNPVLGVLSPYCVEK